MKAIVFALLAFSCAFAQSAEKVKPDFSKITTVTVAEASTGSTSHQWKVDDWPADPNVHQVADLSISSVWAESGGWHFLLNCTNPWIPTMPCHSIAAGAYRAEWKGNIKFSATFFNFSGEKMEGYWFAPDRVTLYIPNGKKFKKVTYKIESIDHCEENEKGQRSCVFFDVLRTSWP
jgi:hypothetical protein